ncbi:unnamed protein product [Brachionus calyciflorus]|uniref:Uncharacterized protein n=1 Tax=Brachionus calyciflorus TaxID=104777 RepID=A0A813SJZ8_9BILA|nr:unnamed protein product [Brachionus calyciflorus]
MNKIEDRKALLGVIDCLIKKIDRNSNGEETENIMKHVQLLSHKLGQTGIIIDDLTGKKYFLTSVKIKGGGPLHSKASEVIEHETKNLCQSGTKAFDTVLNELTLLNANRFRTQTGNRTSRILIQNLSKYPLIYKDSGTYSGYFFSSPMSAFQKTSEINGKNEKNTIEAHNGIGGIFHTKQTDTACSSAGYFSFTVPTPGKNYVVYIGFSSSYRGKSCAGIQIAGQDGVTDSFGRVAGHGIDPTGSLSRKQMYNLMVKSYHNGVDEYDKTEERTTLFKITCKFTNVSWNWFHIIVDDL